MTCLRTYIGLCIYSKDLPPAEITDRLGIEASREVTRDPTSKKRGVREHNLWVWSTRGLMESTDHIEHFRRLFALLEGKDDALGELRKLGCSMEVSCYWDSDGQGGPWLDLATIDALSRFRLEPWWDIYFVRDESSGDA